MGLILNILGLQSNEDYDRECAEREAQRKQERAATERERERRSNHQMRMETERTRRDAQNDKARKRSRLLRDAQTARAKAAHCRSCNGSKAATGGGFWCCRPLIADAERWEQAAAQL